MQSQLKTKVLFRKSAFVWLFQTTYDMMTIEPLANMGMIRLSDNQHYEKG